MEDITDHEIGKKPDGGLRDFHPSRIRSPRYWVTGSKIVTIYGEKPSTIRMTIRLAATFLWFFIQLGMFLDFMWPTGDEERQMLRDLCCGTRIIRNLATPIAQSKSVCSC